MLQPDDLILMYIECNWAEDCFVGAVENTCKVSNSAAERAFNVIEKYCIEKDPELCFKGFGEV